MLFPHIHLFQQVAGTAELVDDKEDVAHIDVDAALQLGVEHDVAAQGLPVAVEGQADELTIGIHDRAAGVTARDVVVGEEADVHGAVLV